MLKKWKMVLPFIFVSVGLFRCATPPDLISAPFEAPPDTGNVEYPVIFPEIELPELPEEEVEKRLTIRYIITPEEGYRNGDGYMKIDFEPSVESEAGLHKGKITVNIGHKKIDGANTKWYGYEVSLDSRILTKHGKTSVPFVRGEEGFWWNEEILTLPEPMKGRVELTVTDEFQNTSYFFTIVKEITESEVVE